MRHELRSVVVSDMRLADLETVAASMEDFLRASHDMHDRGDFSVAVQPRGHIVYLTGHLEYDPPAQFTVVRGDPFLGALS